MSGGDGYTGAGYYCIEREYYGFSDPSCSGVPDYLENDCIYLDSDQFGPCVDEGGCPEYA